MLPDFAFVAALCTPMGRALGRAAVPTYRCFYRHFHPSLLSSSFHFITNVGGVELGLCNVLSSSFSLAAPSFEHLQVPSSTFL